MADATADILLKISANLEGIAKAQEGFKDLQNVARATQASIRKSTDELTNFGANFKEQFLGSVGLGAGFTAGAAAAMGVVNAVRAIGAEIKSVLSEGVMFNAEMEQAKLGIAAALRTFDPDKYHSFQTALQASGTVIDQLKAKSAQFGLSFAPLAEQYTATVGAMFRGGITDIQKQIELTVTLNRSMTTLGITGSRATRDIADILNGVANRTVAGRSLGITDADLKAAADAGHLYEFLNDKLKAFTEAVTASADTVTVLQERLKASATQNAADQTVSLTAAYKELLKSLISFTQSDAFKQTVKFFAISAQALIGQVTDLSDAFSGRGRKASGPERELASGQKQFDSFNSSAEGVRSKEDIDAAMGQGIQTIKDLLNSRSAITAPDAADTEAMKGMDQLIAKTKERMDLLAVGGEKQIAINLAKDQEAQLDARSAQFAREADEARDKLLKKSVEIEAKTQERIRAEEKEIDKAEYIKTLTADRASLEAQLKGPDSNPARYLGVNEAADPAKQAEAKQAAATFVAEKEGQIAQITKEIYATQQAIERIADEAAKKAEATKKAEDKAADDALAKARALASEETARQQRAAVDAIKDDAYLTDRQRKQLLFIEYKKEEASIAQRIAQQQALVDSEPVGSATRAQAQGQLKSLRDRQEVGLPKDEASVQPTTQLQDMTKALNQFASQAKSIGTDIADTINSGLNSIGSNLTALIMKTKDWKQAFGNVANTIVTDLVSSGVRLVTDWVKNELAMTASTLTNTAARSTAHGAETSASVAGTVLSTGTHVAGEATKTGATLTGGLIRIGVTIKEALASVYQAAAGAMSAMASIPYVGPFLAIAAMAAILGVGIGLVGKIGKGFKDGGYTGDGAPGEYAGPAHKGEVVFSQANVAAHGGVAAVEALRVSGRGAYGNTSPVVASGATSTAPTEGSNTPNVSIAHFNTKQDAEQWLRTRKGRRVMNDFQTQQSSEV